MIAAAWRDAASAKVVLSELLDSAGAEFPGIGDPMLLDFGTHRWLREERELAYSDWLAWILEQRNDSGAILSLFGMESSALAGGICEVHREFPVPGGQLDILVFCNAGSVFAIEIKTTSEPEEEQLDRYVAWLKRQNRPVGLVLLGVSKPESLASNYWSFRSWDDVGAGLRTWAAEWCDQGRLMQAAMTLGFCGAVEQNLLGYSRSGINTPDVTRYLESWLETRKNEKAQARP
jgi:hypothetical protein